MRKIYMKVNVQANIIVVRCLRMLLCIGLAWHRWSEVGILTVLPGEEDIWRPYDEPRRFCTVCKLRQVKIDGRWRWSAWEL